MNLKTLALTLGLSCAFGSAALAAEIDFSTVLTDPDGKELLDCNGTDCSKSQKMTVGRAAATALYTASDQSTPADEKWAQGVLAARVHKGGKIDLSPEDIALIKKSVGKVYGPLVVSQVWPILDSTKKASR